MKRSLMCAAWIGMALAGDALAEESGLYVRADLGRSEMRNEAGLGSPNNTVAEDKSDSSWALGVGYHFNRYIALDLGYVDLGKAEAYLSTPAPIEFSGHSSVAIEGTTVALMGMLPIGRWGPYVKAGMLFSKTESRFDGQLLGSSVGYRGADHDEDPFFSGGLRYAAASPLQIYLDVTYFDKVGLRDLSFLNTSLGVLWQF